MTGANEDRRPTGIGLLEGITVVEMAHELTEFAGAILAGLGAAVWLVEPPSGSPTRRRRPYLDDVTPSRRSIPFLARNIGKRSVVVDVDAPQDRAALERLVAAADVVIAHESSALLPLVDRQLPIVRVSDERGVGVSPIVTYAASGALSSSGWPHQPPCNAPSWLALDSVGMFAALAAVLLVREQRRTGHAGECEVPLMEAAIHALTNWTRTMHSYGTASAGQGAETKRLGGGPFPVLPCADGYVRVIPTTDRQWAGFVELLGRPAIFADPIWDSLQFRNDNHDALYLIAAEALSERSTAEVFRRAQALGVPLTPALTIDELLRDEHIASRQLLVDTFDDDAGEVKLLRAPVRTGDPSDVRRLRRAPALGADEVPTGEARTNPVAADDASTLRPLAGLRVLTFGVGAVVPEASSLLALLGADVIKVESAKGLDFFRRIGLDGDVEQAATFNQANLGVRSCCVDAGTSEGQAVLRALVAHCDVVMENMRGPVMRKFGMDYDSVRDIRPDIVYLSSQGFGPGPYEAYVTYGPNLQSFGGMTAIWAHPDDPYPVGSTMAFPDSHAGKQATIAVLAALMRRDDTGEGCYLDCAQFEACVWAIADKVVQHQLQPGSVGVVGNASLDYAPHGCFPCAGDDSWCAIAADDDEQWAALAEIIDDPNLRADEYLTLDGRLAHAEAIGAAVAAWTSTQTAADVVGALRGRVSASILVDGASQAADERLHASGFYAAVARPRAGVRYHTGLPYVFDGQRVPVRRAPLLGEHTEAVLLDVVGMSPTDLSRLVAGQHVGT